VNRKKNSRAAVSKEHVPAYKRFGDPSYQGNPYQWENWGLVIRHLRDFTGMDQVVFGRLLQGYTRSQIGRYETEQTEPPIDFWLKTMRTFGLNLNWAITGEGTPYTLDYADSVERKRFFRWVDLVRQQSDFLRELEGSNQ